MNHPVSLVRCPTYEDDAVQAAVRRAVDLIGGMGRYVQPGQRVLLKPNLLRSSAPEEMICTHPAVVKAVVQLVQEAGGHAVIGDSPGGPLRAVWLRAVYRTSGMIQVAEETGAELNWDCGETRLSHPAGHLIKALEVGTFVTNADVVISLPKLKTHGLMQLTGATKNLFGVIPGTTKMGYHAKFPEPERFGDMLIDILTLIRPALSLMDGVVGMDGQGPSAGDPCNVGALLASADGIALDVVAATLVGMDVSSIYPLRAAMARGLTSGRVSDIEIVGEAFGDLRAQGFRAPDTHAPSRGTMFFLSHLVKRWMVAAPSSNGRCTGCGVCVRHCPVKAITLVEKRAHMDLDTCIRCYCCHELCPERAIDLRKPWLGRLLS